MLKELRALWKNGGAMQDSVERLGQMVGDAAYVFEHAWEVCTGQAIGDKTAEPLARHDKAVNRGERELRRRVVEHLSINPGKDVAGCMAILLMAKDIERIGDHSRNIYGVGVRLPAPVTEFALYADLDTIQKSEGRMLPILQRAIRESNSEIAHELLDRYDEVKQRVKELQDKLFATELETREAVANALLMRFFMRINAHIGNATSGVIFPVENIDFISRGLKQERGQG